ncbi:unnamed protein product, partial [Rotaria sp. Silwood1]
MQTQINTQKEIIDSTLSAVNDLTLNINKNIINIINNLVQLLNDLTPHDQTKNNLTYSVALLGAVYVPPKSSPPFERFKIRKGKEFFLFGDFNAKHTIWSCKTNNSNGVEIQQWLETTGFE